MALLASANQLPSAASAATNGLTITALCKDSNNNAVSGSTVTFSSSAGLLQVTQPETDASGTAVATLTTGGDQSNQSITIPASSGVASASIVIAETGTTIQVTGAQAVGSTAQVVYTVTLTDSSGKGISGRSVKLVSTLGNAITPASQTTDSSGRAQFTYTGTASGSDTLTASSTDLQVSSTFAVSVAASTLSFTSPTANVVIPFNTAQQVTAKYVQGGSPVNGATINFSTTRGTLTSTAACNGSASGALSAVTGADGTASVYLCGNGSQGAGGVILSAAIASGPTATTSAQFQATTPDHMSIEATPATIAPSGTSTVKAVVYDSSNNLVQGQLVDFSLTDPTGGSLSQASGYTDQSGSVSVIYTATSTASAKDGVKVSASIDGSSVATNSPALITVGGQSLHITLGTGNTISPLDDTRYQMPYSVTVTDSAGNPVPNATFNLTIQAIAYQKGTWTKCVTTPSHSCSAGWDWTPIVTSVDSHWNKYPTGQPPPYNILYQLPFGCLTEDPQSTGVLTTALDYNGNGVLDPGAVASVPPTVALDSSGSAQFFITYPKDHAWWTEVLLTGIAAVSGTETTAQVVFQLPILATDISSSSVDPPGKVSPYGSLNSSCASPQ